MKKTILTTLLILALSMGCILSTSAYTMEGTGYVATNHTVSVIVPTVLDFVIDPMEIGGRGSIYSDEYPLENFGNEDVLLTFSSINVTFPNETDFAPSSVPINNYSMGGLKEAYLVLEFGNPDVEPIVLTDSQPSELPSILIEASDKQRSKYSLSITGSVTPLPDTEWKSGDIKISLAFQLDTIATTHNNGGMIVDVSIPYAAKDDMETDIDLPDKDDTVVVEKTPPIAEGETDSALPDDEAVIEESEADVELSDESIITDEHTDTDLPDDNAIIADEVPPVTTGETDAGLQDQETTYKQEENNDEQSTEGN